MFKYECRSCGNVILLKKEEEPNCPVCRGRMALIGKEKKTDVYKCFRCPDCDSVFYTIEPPYKCPFCNYTFPSTPLLQQKEKL